VFALPSVAVLSTGDELIAPGEELVPGKIYESNGPTLAAMLQQLGIRAEILGNAPDEPSALREKLRAGLSRDVLIVTGGISVGERDLVKSELRNLDAELELWRVAIKPGKPFVYGRCGACRVF